MVRLRRPYRFNFFKGCFPQISLGPFLNTLSHWNYLQKQRTTNLITDLALFHEYFMKISA